MISLSGTDRRPRLGALILDIALTEEVSFESEITQYLIEDGSTISDHVTRGAEKLRITGVIPAADALAFTADGSGAARVADVVETARAINRERAVLEVATGQVLYPDMAFSSLRIARSVGEGGDWISVDAELTKVRKVSLRTAEVPQDAKVSEANGAKGRAGQTNKAAGRAGQTGGVRANPGGEQATVNRGESVLRGAREGRGPLGWAQQAIAGGPRP